MAVWLWERCILMVCSNESDFSLFQIFLVFLAEGLGHISVLRYLLFLVTVLNCQQAITVMEMKVFRHLIHLSCTVLC